MKLFSDELVSQVAEELKITNLGEATIGEVLLMAVTLEKKTGLPFIRMDQGSPGLESNRIGRQAEKDALDRGVASQYPAAAGIPELKEAASRFIKAFMNIDISPAACIPTTGSVAASFGSFIVSSQLDEKKNTILFIDPGFPIQKYQLRIIGVDYKQFDIHDYRSRTEVRRVGKE